MAIKKKLKRSVPVQVTVEVATIQGSAEAMEAELQSLEGTVTELITRLMPITGEAVDSQFETEQEVTSQSFVGASVECSVLRVQNLVDRLRQQLEALEL